MAWKPQTRRNEQAVRERRKAWDDRRGTPAERGYDWQWREFSERYRQENPLCADCLEQGIATPSEEVHHIVKLKLRPDLKYEQSNLVALCGACHKRITAAGG